ncbi:MAG: hypothetical protein AAF602_11670, partial [Myxococcota bacterium]
MPIVLVFLACSDDPRLDPALTPTSAPRLGDVGNEGDGRDLEVGWTASSSGTYRVYLAADGLVPTIDDAAFLEVSVEARDVAVRGPSDAPDAAGDPLEEGVPYVAF